MMPSKDEKNAFSIQIETRAEQQGLGYMETILDYCNETGLEVEIAASLVNLPLRSKLELEAQKLRYLPRGSALPI